MLGIDVQFIYYSSKVMKIFFFTYFVYKINLM